MKRLTLALAAASSLAAIAVLPAQAQDAEKGKSQFGQCRACHSLDAGKNGVGPSLHGLFGRTAGTVEKYSYSTDMKLAGEKGLKWDEATVFEYLADPGAFLKKNLAKAGEDVADVAAQGMVELAHRILERSKERDLMPYKTGELAESGVVDASNRNAFTGKFSGTVARVRFTAPHAVIQHETLWYNHPGGGGAKFLERAMDEFAGGKGLSLVADVVRRSMSSRMAGTLTGQVTR